MPDCFYRAEQRCAEFDAGAEAFEDVVLHCGFPWVLSNVKDKGTDVVFGGCDEFTVIERPCPDGQGGTQSIRIGVIGLAERGWFELLAFVSIDDVDVQDYVECARTLGERLRRDHRCDLVVALTHMLTEPNDLRLARECPEIDLVLGGHDHSIEDRALGRSIWLPRRRPFDDEYRAEMKERMQLAAGGVEPAWLAASCFGGATTCHVAGAGNSPVLVGPNGPNGPKASEASSVDVDVDVGADVDTSLERGGAGAGSGSLHADAGGSIRSTSTGCRFIQSDWDFKGLTLVTLTVGTGVGASHGGAF